MIVLKKKKKNERKKKQEDQDGLNRSPVFKYAIVQIVCVAA